MILSHNLKSFLKKTLDRLTFFYVGAIFNDFTPTFYIIVIMVILYILYCKKKYLNKIIVSDKTNDLANDKVNDKVNDLVYDLVNNQTNNKLNESSNYLSNNKITKKGLIIINIFLLTKMLLCKKLYILSCYTLFKIN